MNIRNILSTTHKDVFAFGKIITVPNWANFLAVDGNRNVWLYENKPKYDPDDEEWDIVKGSATVYSITESWGDYSPKSSLITLFEVTTG